MLTGSQVWENSYGRRAQKVATSDSMPRRTFLFLPLLASLTASGLAADDSFIREVRPLLEKYCLNCHEGKDAKADVNLEIFADEGSIYRDPKLWERVEVQLRDKVMPPPKKEQPTDENRTRLAEWVRARLEKPDVSKVPRDAGRKVIHRLSRLEFNNTVRDLLGVTIRPADQFPPDGGGGGGFDNNAGTLFIPPVLMEKYLSAAGEVLAAAKPERLFESRPGAAEEERAVAEKNFASFGARAWRRPLATEEVTRLLGFYDAARKRGDSWEEAMKLGYRAMLVSPHFLFRIELDRPGAEPQPVGPWELASRLSYFLWSSMPDGELFRLAAEGKLHEPAVLAGEVRRMLADPKARTLAENFATQWLRTKELLTASQPATDRYPEYTPVLRDAMLAESVEFFHGLLRDNLPLTDCLDCSYTYANETLARHYGIDGVSGPAMRRVELKDHTRGGVLTMGGVLTLTSYPRRSSPVLRGKWVLEEILGTPPPPPPPLVDTQKLRGEKPEGGQTFRQRLEAHRENANCAGCHARLDPPGFALENFNAVGAWRSEVGGIPIDASGRFVTGETFNGPIELKKLLLTRKDEFARNLAEKMLSYALGRGLEPPDWYIVRQMSDTVAQDGYRTQRLVLEITRSFPFQYRRAADAAKVAER
jgi:mono/diheme cytochrome c family protein